MTADDAGHPTTPRKTKSRSWSLRHWAAVFTLVLVTVMPLFPSSSSSSLLQWGELLRLVLVGVAVSYGLFSKKNNDDAGGGYDGRSNSKMDLFLSGILVAVFDEESSKPQRQQNDWPLVLPLRTLKQQQKERSIEAAPSPQGTDVESTKATAEREGIDTASAESSSDSESSIDVDRKADEFIAKFREQIRLQRIDSIRRSTRHHTE